MIEPRSQSHSKRYFRFSQNRQNRRELIATCQRNGCHYDIASLDIDLKADSETSRLIAVHRRWTEA